MEKKISSVVEMLGAVRDLERDMVAIFTIARDQLALREQPPSPHYGEPSTQWARPADPEPLPGTEGFVSPAPPDAPKLPPPRIDPFEAYKRLQRDLHAMRTVAVHLRNSAKLIDGLAELIERQLPRA